MAGRAGEAALYGGEFITVRPPVCRRSFCADEATRDDGLCREHGVEQDWIRTEAALAIQAERDGRRIGRHRTDPRMRRAR